MFGRAVYLPMTADQKTIHSLVSKVNRQLTKLAAKPDANGVHRFRTGARRMEALLTELAAKPGRNDKKLLKLLGRLRKKAGRVRDLDVQISLLRGLKMAEGARHKAQLLQTLMEEQVQAEKKVAAAFDKSTVRELRKRLKRAGAKLKLPEPDALSHAQHILSKLERSKLEAQPDPSTDKVLHQYRIMGKRARYLAELAGPKAAQLVQQLKRMQDALGDWHDWLKLTQRAENLFSTTPGSPLVAALRNLTRVKFRHAVTTLTETRAGLQGKKPARSEDLTLREGSATVSNTRTAA
jgi:CHAD domain-containing protein